MIKTCDNCTKNCDAFDKVCCIFNSYCNFDPNNNAIKKEIEYNCKKCKNKKCDKCILKLTLNLIEEGKFDKLKNLSDKYNKRIREEETSSEITADEMFDKINIEKSNYGFYRNKDYLNCLEREVFYCFKDNVIFLDDTFSKWITLEELKAIKQKCKELGWLDEE